MTCVRMTRSGVLLVLVLALAVAGLLLVGPAAAQSRWHPYANARFGFAIEYPADVFVKFDESENGDGRTYWSADEAAMLRVYGFWNDARKTPAAYVSEFYADKPLAYSAVKRDFFVASGSKGADTFYDRCNFIGNRVVCVNMVYPAAKKTAFDAIVARVAKSMRDSGRGSRQSTGGQFKLSLKCSSFAARLDCIIISEQSGFLLWGSDFGDL
jgi:hypothetical protein